MNEFFDPIPNGAFRPTRSYFDRLQRAVERSSRFPEPLSSPGAGGQDSSGSWVHLDGLELLYAEIVAPPAGGYPGYSWRERRPAADGAYEVPESPRSGDNGSEALPADSTVVNAGVAGGVATVVTDVGHELHAGDRVTVAGAGDPFDGSWVVAAVTAANAFTFDIASGDVPPAGAGGTVSRDGLPAFQPAFDLNGNSGIAPGTVVVLMRGFKHVGGTDAANTPDTLGPGYVPGQEYVILAGAGAAGKEVDRLRITGRPACVGGKRYYPAVIDLVDAAPAADDFHDGTAVWLRQRLDAPLGTGGRFFCLATRERASFAVTAGAGGPESRPLYVTEKRMYALGFTCDTDTGQPVPVYEDDCDCRCADSRPALDFSVAANSQYVGMF